MRCTYVQYTLGRTQELCSNMHDVTCVYLGCTELKEPRSLWFMACGGLRTPVASYGGIIEDKLTDAPWHLSTAAGLNGCSEN
jgi:hypothetical protein